MSTIFRLDVWVGDVILTTRYPILCVMAVNGDAVINDYLVGNTWEIS